MIIILQKSDTWKIQLTCASNFIPSKDDEDRVKCGNKEFHNLNEVIMNFSSHLFQDTKLV